MAEGCSGLCSGRGGSAATRALRSDPGLKNNDFSAVWHLAPIPCRVAGKMLVATCRWDHFLACFAQLSMTVQGSGHVAWVLPASEEEEDAVQKIQPALQCPPGAAQPGMGCSQPARPLNSCFRRGCAGHRKQERDISSSLWQPGDIHCLS